MPVIKTQEIYNPLYLLLGKIMIFLVTGGRGSGKSFNASTAVQRFTYKKGHKILYTRYTMSSAEISVIPEFQEKIDADHHTKDFRTTSRKVINRRTKSEVLFRGIKTSSGNQTAKLKSIHGITGFVVDEAEEWVSEEDFEKIALSIRELKAKNFIIIIMNPADSNHWVYKRFIENTHKIVYYDGVPVQISTHPNVCHIHTTYLDNLDHLSPQFIEEVRRMKEENPEKYAHVVIGRWADVAEGAVFKKFGIVEDFPSWAKKVANGLDFGFTHDPSAIIRCGIVDNDLYLDEICYKTGMLSSDLIKELRKHDLFVYAESADPRLIQEIANGGIVIYPVQKGPGSIVAGIDKIKDFDNIFITKRSYNLIREARNYVWAKDKNGNYINEPEDHDNHGWDAVRYYVNGKILGNIIAPKNYSKSDLGIY